MRIIQINICLLLLLGIGLNCHSLRYHVYNSGWSDASLNNATPMDVFNLNKMVDFIGKLQLMWVPDSNFFRTANAGIEFDLILNKEDAYPFKNWMIHPDSLLTSVNNYSYDGEIYTEDEIPVENWMINTSAWNKSSFR